MKRMVRRIAECYHDAPPSLVLEGLCWYANAHRIAAVIADGDALAGSGVLASLSPMTSWPRNIILARMVWTLGDCPHTMRCRIMAKAIRLGAPPLCVLCGPKVRAFHTCIVSGGDTDAVCVDRHAFDAAMGRRMRRSPRASEYPAVAEAYRSAASTLSVPPPVVQATVWCVQRMRIDPTQQLFPF